MQTHSLKPLICVFCVIVLTVLSCSSPLHLFIFPTATSTFTNTPTFTSTPTNTPTPTAVIPPPVFVTGCVFPDDCPDANSVVTYLTGDLQSNVFTQVAISYTDIVRVDNSWCTKDEASLQESIQHISYIFKIDGISYLDLARVEQGVSSDTSDPSIQYTCSFIGATLSGWQVNKGHRVEIGYSFDSNVSDGWRTRTPFTSVYKYSIHPLFIPTETPTLTPSPTRTAQPLPTIPYNTPEPACEASSSITITNSTDGEVVLYLTGPTNFTFYLGAGDTTISVCEGTYDYEATGCGGATNSGSMSSGESHEFYCSG
jgi:hypothetical protein